MRVIDGTAIAAQIQSELKDQIEVFVKETGKRPVLAVLSVGEDPASQLYVSKKLSAAEKVGITAYRVWAENAADIEKKIQALNNDDSVHAYILQLPLPTGVDPCPFFSMLDPRKDVDVFHPENVGLLVQGRPRFRPCTPHGIQQMLFRSGIQVAEKKVVVINRSNVVGKPLSSMLIQECDDYANATVTICHDRTPPELLRSVTRSADIVVVAVGKPGFLTADMIRPGAGVVDVGITRQGNKVLGDADPGIQAVAGWFTPVPGGVGPMTVTMLLENTLAAARAIALQR